MISRERVLTSLAHHEPDRVPLDFGSTSVSGIHVTCVAALRDYFGLEKRPIKAYELGPMLGWLDDDLLEALGADTCGLIPPLTTFGQENANCKTWRAPFGLEVLVSGGFQCTLDTNGDVLVYPQGDTDAPPSAIMPHDGYFFDSIVRQPPIDDEKLDPVDNLEEYGPIADRVIEHYKNEIQRACGTGRAVVAGFGGTSFGDIARVPAPSLKHPKGIRDVAEWYVSLVTRRDYVHQVFAGQRDIALANLQRIHAAIGDSVDVTYLCGTDFGTQTSSFCSVDTYRELFMPYYKSVNDWIHRNTKWKTFKHSCGAVEKFMDVFIESGFDIINPVQCSAAGMDPEHLKRTYGDRLVFWGGGVDTQKVLPFGTPADVRRQVLERCEIFSRGGGFVFNAIHNVQARTPVENIVAMIEAVHEFNGTRR
ncbi:MAG: methyltransferase [Phycisphaerales bacterium]|nr:methyltransferase [Phycisphaerales bacterium]